MIIKIYRGAFRAVHHIKDHFCHSLRIIIAICHFVPAGAQKSLTLYTERQRTVLNVLKRCIFCHAVRHLEDKKISPGYTFGCSKLIQKPLSVQNHFSAFRVLFPRIILIHFMRKKRNICFFGYRLNLKSFRCYTEKLLKSVRHNLLLKRRFQLEVYRKDFHNPDISIVICDDQSFPNIFDRIKCRRHSHWQGTLYQDVIFQAFNVDACAFLFFKQILVFSSV